MAVLNVVQKLICFWMTLLCAVSGLVAMGGARLRSVSLNLGMRGARLFHPAFPLELLKPLSESDLSWIEGVRELLRAGEHTGADFSSPSSGLPWMPLPRIGISDSQNVWSKREIEEAFQRNRHVGHVVWAEKLHRPERGCFLLNHWKQTAVYVQEYDPARGARGYLVRTGSGPTEFINWPPLALEIELADKKWQAVLVSDNIANGTVLQLLPAGMTKAVWELILLLLLDPEEHEAETQALMDTGLSPKQGLIAYLRLLDQVQRRLESFDDVPEYRKIFETAIVPPVAPPPQQPDE